VRNRALSGNRPDRRNGDYGPGVTKVRPARLRSERGLRWPSCPMRIWSRSMTRLARAHQRGRSGLRGLLPHRCREHGRCRPSKLEDLLSVRAAAMLAHLYTGIAKLPQGYQALILCWVG